MKLLILAFICSLSFAFAQTADIRCDLSSPIVLQNNFGVPVAFRSAQISIENFDGTNSAFMTISDRFGPSYEVFSRLWTTNRCPSDTVCLSTSLSGLSGLTIQIPEETLDNNYYNYTGRVRDNRRFRTYFASCRSSLR